MIEPQELVLEPGVVFEDWAGKWGFGAGRLFVCGRATVDGDGKHAEALVFPLDNPSDPAGIVRISSSRVPISLTEHTHRKADAPLEKVQDAMRAFEIAYFRARFYQAIDEAAEVFATPRGDDY